MRGVWQITGVQGPGKSTLARQLGLRMSRAVHIPGDQLLRYWVVSGVVFFAEDPEEGRRQVQLCIKSQGLLAQSDSDAGFVPILDSVVWSRHDLESYQVGLASFLLYFVVLEPSVEVALHRVWSELDYNERDKLSRKKIRPLPRQVRPQYGPLISNRQRV